jgi:hypothetical protein
MGECGLSSAAAQCRLAIVEVLTIARCHRQTSIDNGRPQSAIATPQSAIDGLPIADFAT